MSFVDVYLMQFLGYAGDWVEWISSLAQHGVFVEYWTEHFVVETVGALAE